MLDLEARFHRLGGVKADAIADEFGVNETRYYQRLNALVERPEALAHDAITVNRLRRLRDRRSRRPAR